jgi:hypothetical protein
MRYESAGVKLAIVRGFDMQQSAKQSKRIIRRATGGQLEGLLWYVRARIEAEIEKTTAPHKMESRSVARLDSRQRPAKDLPARGGDREIGTGRCDPGGA